MLKLRRIFRDSLTEQGRKLQVIGLCRFSYPCHGGFKVNHETIRERSAYLYAPERLKQRFRSFETLTLPSLRAQTDQDFQFLIVTGDDLPPDHADKLRALVADIPQVTVLAMPPLPHREAMQQAINLYRRSDDSPCIQFRLDDDDAVGRHFIGRLRMIARSSAALFKSHQAFAVDFNKGYLVRPGAEGLAVKEIIQPYWSAALGVVMAPGNARTVMSYSHHRLNQLMPTITLPDPHMYLRGVNDHNDSNQTRDLRKFSLDPLDPDGETLFAREFGVDMDHLRRVFAAPGG